MTFCDCRNEINEDFPDCVNLKEEDSIGKGAFNRI